jgi:Domain of unknown function (DUF4062)
VAIEPTVFISSTIRDFADLRLALKWWFEERGYRVLLSECTDFEIDPNQGTVENCLAGVRSCQYVVVLVGFRAGSYYSRAEGISITRREYREAYEGVQAGRTKLVTCVRKDVDEALASQNWQPFGGEVEGGLVRDFVNEVKRNDEMKAASETGGPFPSANWVYLFRDFRELTTALLSSFRLGGGLRRKALEANLLSELKANLRIMLTKVGSKVVLRGTFESLQRELELKVGDSLRVIYPSRQQLTQLTEAVVSVAAFRIHEISSTALQDAVSSGEFLEFRSADDNYTVGRLQVEMVSLREEIVRLEHILALPQLQGIAGKVISSQRKGLAAYDLATLFGAANTLHNVIARTASLCAYLSRLVTGIPAVRLMPISPFAENAEEVEKERPTYSEIYTWLKGQFCKEE